MQCLLGVIAFAFSIVAAKVMVMVGLVFFAVVMTKVRNAGVEKLRRIPSPP